MSRGEVGFWVAAASLLVAFVGLMIAIAVLGGNGSGGFAYFGH